MHIVTWNRPSERSRWTVNEKKSLRWILFVIFLSIINSFAWYERNDKTKKKLKRNWIFRYSFIRGILNSTSGFQRKRQFVTCGRCFTNWINLWCTLHLEIFIWRFSIEQIISLMIGREECIQCIVFRIHTAPLQILDWKKSVNT